MAEASVPYYKDRAIRDFYDIGAELGRGAFSTVKRGTEIKTKKDFALKILNKKFVKMEILEREIKIMQKLHHPHVLSMHEVYEDKDNVYIVLDLVTGGELFEKVVERGHFSEQQACTLVQQILGAVSYLHKNGIAHRDLKPENLLCSPDKANIHIYVSDFGLSKIVSENEFQQMSTQCGSLEYCAPEVLLGEMYEKSVDMWSVGVITYILLTGFFPFYDPTRNAAVLYQKIQEVQYDWEDCPTVTKEAKDFVSKLLVYDSKKRFTADEALEHKWMSSGSSKTLSSEHLPKSFSRLMNVIKKKM